MVHENELATPLLPDEWHVRDSDSLYNDEQKKKDAQKGGTATG